MQKTTLAGAALLVALTVAAGTEEKPSGYLCCNLRTDGSWISDINYAENGKTVIALGTPLKVTGW